MAEDRYLDLPDVRIRYVEAGSGDPVILVHGYMVDLDEQWLRSGVFARLARNFRVIAYDNRGHGKSQKFHDRAAYGIELANDLVRVLDALDLNKAHVVGYSMGAMIVARNLIMRHGRFLSATLGGGAGRFVWTDQDRARNEADARDIRRQMIKGHILRLWPDAAPKPTNEELQRLNDESLAGRDVEALACVRVTMEALAAPLADVAAATDPLLGIAGTADPFHADLLQLKQAKPTMRLVSVPGASHANAPAASDFQDALERFLIERRASGELLRNTG